MSQPLLLTPGPVAVPNFVLEAISQPVIPHRSEKFETFYHELLEYVKYLFQTEANVCTMISSGTGGVEAAMYSLFRPGDEVLILSMGKFSARWVDYGALLGLNVKVIEAEWGKNISKEQILQVIDSSPAMKGVVLTHCETSSGVLLDLEEISYSIKKTHPDILLLVDAITTAGVMPFYLDAWAIDCAVTASQKALMNPAGIVCFALSQYGRSQLQESHSSDYRNLYNYIDFAEKNNYPYTPPVQILYGLHAALKHIKGEGLPARWNKAQTLAQYFRRGLDEIGGKVFSESPAHSLTAFTLESRDLNLTKKYLEAEGILLSGGQAHLKGKILRISHMGETEVSHMQSVLSVLKSENQF